MLQINNMLPLFFAMTSFILINIYHYFGKTYDLIFKLEAEFTMSCRRER
jgi:hypothetical protein